MASGLRVSQLDATRLDTEVVRLLVQQIQAYDVFPYVVLDYAGPIFEYLLWYNTIWKDKSTPGLSLQNLRVARESSDKSRGNNSFHSCGTLKLPGTERRGVHPILLDKNSYLKQFNPLSKWQKIGYLLIPFLLRWVRNQMSIREVVVKCYEIYYRFTVSKWRNHMIYRFKHEVWKPFCRNVFETVFAETLDPLRKQGGNDTDQIMGEEASSNLDSYVLLPEDIQLFRQNVAQLEQRFNTIYDRISKVLHGCAFAQFIAFLGGWSEYASLLLWVLRIRLVPYRIGVNRPLALDYMRRFLIWGAMSDTLSELLPLINLRKVARMGQEKAVEFYEKTGEKVKSVWGYGERKRERDSVIMGIKEDTIKGRKSRRASQKINNNASLGVCPVCNSSDGIPYRVEPCSHVFCYTCIWSETTCPECGEDILALSVAAM